MKCLHHKPNFYECVLGTREKPELENVGERQTSLPCIASVFLVSVMKMQKLLCLLIDGGVSVL